MEMRGLVNQYNCANFGLKVAQMCCFRYKFGMVVCAVALPFRYYEVSS